MSIFDSPVFRKEVEAMQEIEEEGGLETFLDRLREAVEESEDETQ